VLRWIKHAGAGHTGGSLSCLDILNVLYNRILRVSPETFSDPNRDRYVQSKGHSVEALFVVLADRGFFPGVGSRHPLPATSPLRRPSHAPRAGIEQNTGALGHGLPLCVGRRSRPSSMRRLPRFHAAGRRRTGRGIELGGALAAAHYQLDNLTAIIDCNTLQITGRTRDVMNHEPLDEKWPPSAGPCGPCRATICRR
jgi:transketolase